MKVYVAIDQGNSRIKASFYRATEEPHLLDILDEIVHEGEADETFLLILLEKCAEHRTRKGIYASTRGLDARFATTMQQHLNDGLLIFTPSTPLPIDIKYDSRSTLGADRIAAAVGAATLFPKNNSLVVDLGTCMTIDLVANHVFLGGNISPGLEMRLKAMHEHTGSLPLLTAEDFNSLSASNDAMPIMGYDTRSAMLCGAFQGVMSEIRTATDLAREQWGADNVVITGGDADLICNNARGASYNKIPHLVAMGLILILLHNEKI